MRRARIAFVNVGANSSHSRLRSPVFDDTKFEFVPIPDPILSLTSHNLAVRYEDLRACNGIPFQRFIPARYHKQFVHADPEFHRFTYGDYPEHSPRASNLKKIDRGDYILFFSRLVPWRNGHFCGRPGFFLIGIFEIERVFRGVSSQPKRDIFPQIQTNAHVIRGKCDPMLYDGFWVFKGSENSRRFEKAIPLDRKMVEKFGLVDRDGRRWKWRRFRSDLAAIGSYLRSVKVVEDQTQVSRILAICGFA